MIEPLRLLGLIRHTSLRRARCSISPFQHFQNAGNSRFSSSRTSEFKYSRLQDGDIRLLKIVENDEKFDLNFTLETHRLSAAPTYTALSYAWGEDIASRPITLDGVAFPVRSNLWAALYHIKKQLQWHYLWVDAISINQNDIIERNAQVRVMHDIFRGANTVTAWLGPARSPGLAKDNLNMSNLSQSETFLEISRRPYWSRMWIVQELLVAKEVQLKIGHHNFDFEYLKSLIHVDDSNLKEDDVKPSFVAPFLQTRDPDRFPRQPLPLLDLLFAFQHCKCSDVRDKVFSLLALMPSYEQDILRKHFPDYSLAADEVFMITLSFLRTVSRPSSKTWSDHVLNALGVEDVHDRNSLLLRSKRLDTTLFAASEHTSSENRTPEIGDTAFPDSYRTCQAPITSRHSREKQSQLNAEQLQERFWSIVDMLRHQPASRVRHMTFATIALGAAMIMSLYLSGIR